MISPLFSIIIPTYNSEKTLHAALESLLSQSYTDFEIIIVDGLSKDNTASIAEKYEKKDKRVKFFSEKDNGIYDAMNKGIGLSKGRWLFFLGSDDFLYNSKVLEVISGVLEVRDYDFVYGNVYLQKTKTLYDGEFDLEKLLNRNISHQSIFFKRSTFDKIGNFNIKYRTHADWDFNIRCFENTYLNIKFVPTVVSFFAEGGASANNDVPFLRKSLLPAKLREVDRRGFGYLTNIVRYDEWWRLIRNSKWCSDSSDFPEIRSQKMFTMIKNMIGFQKKIPEKIINIGVFSKILMSLSYLSCKMSKII